MQKGQELSVAEVAKLLEVSNSTIYKLINTGQLPAHKGIHGYYHVQLKDIIDFVRAQRALTKENHALLRAELEKVKEEARSDINKKGDFSPLITRRRFLKGSLSFVLGTMAGFTLNTLSNTTGSFVYEQFATAVQEKREAQHLIQAQAEMIESLFGRLFSFSWSTNLTHFIEAYGLNNIWFSNTARASVALGSVLGVSDNDWMKSAVLTDEFPGPVRVDGDIIAIGSPVSDPVTRLNMEYSGESRYSLARIADPLIDLPITYEIGISLHTGSTTPVKRYVAGGEKDKPNTTVRVNNELLSPPKLDRNGWLMTDYLLITRMPNLISRQAFLNSSEVLIIGGTHGVGTEAISLLVHDTKLLSNIVEQRNGVPYYQILVPIAEIEHGLVGALAHSKPITLGSPIVEEIQVDVEKIIRQWT